MMVMVKIAAASSTQIGKRGPAHAMTKLLYGFADEEAEMELGMGGRLSKGCPPKVL